MPEHRFEYEILQDLEKLCTSPGYVHALATICWRSNFIEVEKNVHSDNLKKMISQDKLLRSEISILIGFMVKSSIDIRHPSIKIVDYYIEKTDELMEELHHAINSEFLPPSRNADYEKNSNVKPVRGKSIKESIFYSGEAAYMFQYRDLCAQRYKNDEDWFISNKGFSPAHMRDFFDAAYKLQNRKLHFLRVRGIPKNLDTFTLLPVFVFTDREIADEAVINFNNVKNILSEFSIKSIPCNKNFIEIGAFNETNAFPIIPLSNGKYFLFQLYSLAEAFYENPFFWMMQDENYLETFKKNRGLFTEKFCAERLVSVFSAQRIYNNVYILDGQGQKCAEIDVLAIYADRAIIVQAKSKKLTEAAKKGSDETLQSDFKKSVQHAYDQGLRCSKLLLDESYHITNQEDEAIEVRRNFTEIFIFCVTSEYYPALSHQARHFLKVESNSIIRPPYVIDIFFLDVICELLQNPLLFFSFLHQRLKYFDKILCENELSVLSYHLIHNLWFREELGLVYLGEDFCAHVDAAMLSRREGWPGHKTPEGILTKLKGYLFERLIKDIGTLEVDGVFELGYFFLEMSEESAKELSRLAELIIDKSKQDGGCHSFSMGVGRSGITVHSGFILDKSAYQRLYVHCVAAKRRCKARSWFGLGLDAGCGGAIGMMMRLGCPE